MSTLRVAYTDPVWALRDGRPDPALAEVERSVLGPGVRVDVNPAVNGGYVTDGAPFLAWLAGADAIVVYRATVTEDLLKAAGRCQVVARQGVGVDNLNGPMLARHGVVAFNVPDYCVDEVAVQTMALLLALERHVCVQDREVKHDRWNIYAGGVPRRLSDLTAGIIGFGRIGRAVGQRLRAFYGAVHAYDPYVHADLMAGYGVRKAESLRDLLGGCDAIVLHAALDDETRGMLDAGALAHLRPGSMLVNAARGALVVPSAVLAALRDGRLGGYAADVFTPEDPNADPVNRALLRHDNVVVSAHRAFLSAPSERSQRVRVAEEVRRVLLDGAPPRFGRVGP